MAFSTDPEMPIGDERTGCFATELSVVTSQNKAFLYEYVNGINAEGSTYYAKALTAAFNIFKQSSNTTSRK